MIQCTSFIAVVIVINTLTYCSAESVYCVTPTTASRSRCPHITYCATLSHYAQEAQLYFTSDATIVFLPGNHTLDRDITVANVANLTIRGQSPIARVICNGPVGFHFTNTTNLNILSLAFTSCNMSWSYAGRRTGNSALFLQSTLYAKLVNCSFHANLGIALAVIHTIIAVAENEFVHNQCGRWSFTKIRGLGCGITALNSTLTFTGNTTFFNNSQTGSCYYCPRVIGNCFFYCAGAIWASASSLHFHGTNNFIGNRAESGSGGAIHVENNMSLSFNGSNTFSHNTAGYDGGAIDSYKNVVFTFIGVSNFIHNSAQRFGGAIRANSNTSLNFTGTSNFTHNSAVYDSTHNSAGYGDGGVHI